MYGSHFQHQRHTHPHPTVADLPAERRSSHDLRTVSVQNALGIEKDGVPDDWQNTVLDGGQWCFSLPAGSMQVRVRSVPGPGSTARASEASAPLVFRVKGTSMKK